MLIRMCFMVVTVKSVLMFHYWYCMYLSLNNPENPTNVLTEHTVTQPQPTSTPVKSVPEPTQSTVPTVSLYQSYNIGFKVVG